MIDRVFDDHIVSEMTNELLMESHGNCQTSKLLFFLRVVSKLLISFTPSLNFEQIAYFYHFFHQQKSFEMEST